MGASDLLERLTLAGVRLSVLGPDQLAAEPRAALTDELRALIRTNKSALLAALARLEPGRGIRQQRALTKLADSPDLKRVAIFDIEANPTAVICTLAIRDVGTCELTIPRDKYDPWLLLHALDLPNQ